MPGKKPTKSMATKAAKVLRSEGSSARAKTAAAKTLSQRSIAARAVHPAPKKGTVSRAAAKRAVRALASSPRGNR